MSPITTDFDAVLSWPLTLAICASIIAAASTEFFNRMRARNYTPAAWTAEITAICVDQISQKSLISSNHRKQANTSGEISDQTDRKNASSKGVTMRYQPEICRCSVFAPDRQVTGSHGAPPSVAEAAASGAVVAYRRRLRVPHIVPELTPAQVWPAALIEVMIMLLTSVSCVSSRSS